jgi:hypothetical protein
VRSTIPALALAVITTALLVPLPAADEGWLIERFNSRIDIRPDGTLDVFEAIDVDFRGLSRHGIYRDIPFLIAFDTVNNREYVITLSGVSAADGRPHQV